MNEHLRKALMEFFGEVAKNADDIASEKAVNCFRLLGGNVADLEVKEAPAEDTVDNPSDNSSDGPVGDQD